MPIYEYICLKCNKKFEILTSTGNKLLVKCSICNSIQVKKVFSLFGIGKSSSSFRSASSSSCSTCSTRNCSSCN
ncbi:MAG: zinc ribbon domain-containing protein [bacterium]|nr:zinc ribbon domain-containing protein [bacterium]